MRCDIARYGRRGLKPPKLENLGFGFCTQGPRMTAHMVPRMAAYIQKQQIAESSLQSEFFFATIACKSSKSQELFCQKGIFSNICLNVLI